MRSVTYRLLWRGLRSPITSTPCSFSKSSRTPKDYEERSIVVSDTLLGCLKRYRGRATEDALIFPSPTVFPGECRHFQLRDGQLRIRLRWTIGLTVICLSSTPSATNSPAWWPQIPPSSLRTVLPSNTHTPGDPR